MALIKCPECGKKISDTAISCPNCGYNLSPKNQKKVTTVKTNLVRVGSILVIIGNVLSLICFIIYFCMPEDEGDTLNYTIQPIVIINIILTILSILYLAGKLKDNHLKIYGFLSLILSILLGIITTIEFRDCCSLVIYETTFIVSVIGSILNVAEIFTKKN